VENDIRIGGYAVTCVDGRFDRIQLLIPRPAQNLAPGPQWNFRESLRFFHEHAETSNDKNKRQ